MSSPNPLGPNSTPEPESTPPEPSKVFLGSPTLLSPNPITNRRYQRALEPEPEPPFWIRDWFKFMVFLLVVGSVGGWAYYQFFWLVRLPQERDLTDLQGKSMHVSILGHDDVLLKYTLPGSETERYLSLATLTPADQQFIAKLSPTTLARLPFTCTLTDSTGKETAVRLLTHNDNWAQCALIADGSTHYIFLSTLAPSDQAVIRLLPGGLNFQYPMNYVFTGPPQPGENVQLLGRNDNTVEYLELTSGQKYFAAISQLSQTDQAFIREFPLYIVDRPTQALENQPVPQLVPAPASRLANNDSGPNSPINSNMLKSLVIIKGDYSEGSGFIAKLHGQYFVVTNEHVLSGNKEFTITDMDGNRLPTNGALYGAIDYDVAILKIPDNFAKNYLEIIVDPQNNAKVGDPITVSGNSLGAGVPSQINGQLMAIGPELVEISAQLTHGISGSPIIDRSAGKVIGIATMSITYKVNADYTGITTETRWFGYRVDNIDPDKGWVKMDWARFRDEGIKVRDAVDLYMSLDAVLKDKATMSISSELVHTVINDFQSEISLAGGHNNKREVQLAFQSLNSKLRSLADNGTTELSNATLYPYHANIVKELDDLRKYMDQAFEDNSRVFKNLVQAGR